MSYVLRGRLRGYVSPDLLEPLSDMTVKLYRTRADQDVETLASADPKHTFAVLNGDEVREKDYAFFAQTRTNDDGEFTIDLSTKTIFGHRGATHGYAGEPFEVDIYCKACQGYRPEADKEPVQFTITVLQPEWQQEGEGQVAYWEYDISQRFWCEVRAALDSWVITGRVTRCGSDTPLEGLRVHAFDADLVQDDDLGSAVTDAEGKFRIDFSGKDFRDTPVRGVGYEAGGPDLYFRIEGADGRMVLDEKKERGSQPDRENVGNCFHVDLCVEGGG
jgi:hypothetical protein